MRRPAGAARAISAVTPWAPVGVGCGACGRPHRRRGPPPQRRAPARGERARLWEAWLPVVRAVLGRRQRGRTPGRCLADAAREAVRSEGARGVACWSSSLMTSIRCMRRRSARPPRATSPPPGSARRPRPRESGGGGVGAAGSREGPSWCVRTATARMPSGPPRAGWMCALVTGGRGRSRTRGCRAVHPHRLGARRAS